MTPIPAFHPRMIRLLLAGCLASTLLFLQGCKLGGDCSCTLIGCPDGLFIHYAFEPRDSAAAGNFRLAVKLPGGKEIVPDESWHHDTAIEFHFVPRTLGKQQPTSVEYQVFDGSGGLLAEGVVQLEWTTRLCNHCSGSSSSCTDQYTTHATAHVDARGKESE